ncbi:MAG: hypothetical protein KH452_02645 [Clostridiales bacterium]|nr:hypothetical protein [Clostridiales bacterium]
MLLMEYDKEAEEAYIRKESLETGIEQGIEQGISLVVKTLIQTFQEIGISRDNTLFKLEEKFSLSTQEAERYLNLYWSDKQD